MQIDLGRILAHANQRLAFAGPEVVGPEHVEAFKQFLKIETERLRMRHRLGLSGGEIASARSYQVDLVVSRVSQLAASESDVALNAELRRCALVALGGYGRRELAPFSDVDLMFLHGGNPSDEVKRFFEQILMLLWDVGLVVGHSFRSIAECVLAAREDLHSHTALAEARFIAGDEDLFRQLLATLDEAVFSNKRATENFLEAMRHQLEDRYAKFGRAVCIQEPNVKESPGGLRDLHAVLWVGHARFASHGLLPLRTEGRISEAEYVSARRAYEFVARVRNEAHFSTGRKTDLLTLDVQPGLATSLGYKPKRGRLASELFMRDYYLRASELHRFSRNFLLRSLPGIPEKRPFFFSLPRKRAKARGIYELREGKLYLAKTGREAFEQGAHRLLEAFAVAQAEGLETSDELKLAIRENLHRVDRAWRASREANRAFLKLLERRGRVASTLRAMHETGFLGRFLPEFARITFIVQHDFYHKYTVDEHTLKAIEALDQVAEGGDPALLPLGKVFDEVENAAPLYLGLLLHDIGKGRAGGHVARGERIVTVMARRMHLPPETAEEVLFLVRAHLDMSQLSQRRDLSEQSLIESFAANVGTLNRLNMLMLLTYADHCGVGPGIWNEWKGSLLWDLYRETRHHLTVGRPLGAEAGGRKGGREKAMRELLAEHPTSAVEPYFAMMPERYLRTTEAAQMVRHFGLVQSLPGRAAVLGWRTLADQHCTELTVCTRDQPGIFARMAGTLTAQGANILSVDLYTRDDGVVIDTFKVSDVGALRPLRPERWPKVEKDLLAALEGRLDVAEGVVRWLARTPRRARRRGSRPLAPAVRFDSESSALSTVVEVKAEDQPGLAYTIAHTLATLGLNITFAKLATDKSHAFDVFYVTGADAQKLKPADMPRVEAALLSALGQKAKAELADRAG